uniref:Uncharacterized protein n=1 Tax=Polytomella parva TaxID=51329 RepID=A0A7S0VP48_9CHLO|mmetsp:Transcript_8307/g.15991  ORF Transcript_8307/g.15991 Transcript_8307/m.15991 type:complete len:164 (+) Transcript_8307:72-563(+)
MSEKNNARERLDVPAVTPLERSLLINKPEKPKFEPIRRSNLLDKLGQFMPQMEAANKKLEETIKANPANDFDIETLNSENDNYIEMDLACGILELKDMAGLKAAEAAMNGQSAIQIEKFSASDDGSDTESSDSEVMEEDASDGETRNVKKKAKKGSNKIVELS